MMDWNLGKTSSNLILLKAQQTRKSHQCWVKLPTGGEKSVSRSYCLLFLVLSLPINEIKS